MTVIDAIIKLQQLDPNSELMIDGSKEEGNQFRFLSVIEIDEAELPTGQKVVICFPYESDLMPDETANN